MRGELTAGGVVADSRAANDTEARGEGTAGRWGRSSIHRRQLTVAALWCGVTTELQHVTLFGGPHLSVFRTRFERRTDLEGPSFDARPRFAP